MKGEFPFLRNRAVQVQPGHENHVEVSGVKISADPAIHSQDTALFRERTNLRQKGILAFYGKDVHSECNQVCEKLGLACKRPDAEGNEGATVRVVDDADLFCKDDDMVDFICDLCLKISKL